MKSFEFYIVYLLMVQILSQMCLYLDKYLNLIKYLSDFALKYVKKIYIHNS